MSKESLYFYFDFSPKPIYDNEMTLIDLERSVDRGCVETIEAMFDIIFAAGIENNKPYYLTLDEQNQELLTKYDGMVSLSAPPRDNETEEPFKKNKLTFRIDYYYDKDGEENGWKTYINSKLRGQSN